MALLSAQNKAQDQLSFDRCIGAIKISEPFSSFCHPWMNHFSRVPPLLLEFTLQISEAFSCRYYFQSGVLRRMKALYTSLETRDPTFAHQQWRAQLACLKCESS